MDELEYCEKIRKEILNDKTTSPLKAIHNFCIECMGYHKTWVKDCTAINCPLYLMRTGKNEAREKKQLSEEERSKLAERMKDARIAKSSN